MRFIQRVRAAYKAYAGGGDAFIRGASVVSFDSISDWLSVRDNSGPMWSNSAVMACLAWIMDTLPEARTLVKTGKGEDDDPTLDASPWYEFVRYPSATLDWTDLLGSTGFGLALDGNAYWLLGETKRYRPIVEWIPSTRCKPCAPRGSEHLGATHYEIRRQGGRVERVEPDRIVQFRQGQDPENPLLGLSRPKSAMLEIMSDQEATVYTHALMKNPKMGTIVTLANPEATLDDATAEKLKTVLAEQLGGRNRHELAIPSEPLKFDQLGFPPDKMAIRENRKTPEERICAVFRIPPIVVGLGAGLDRSTYSNTKEAREMAVEQCLAPMWRKIANTITTKFFPLIGADVGEAYLEFDLSGVRALQDDLDALYVRADRAFRGGLVTRGEGRSLLGFEERPGDEVFYTDLQAGQGDAAALKTLFANADERRRVLEAAGVPDSV